MQVVDVKLRRAGVLLLSLLLCRSLLADDTELAQDWNYLAELYLWAPNVDIETADGTRQEIEFSDLLKVTEMGGMGGLYAQRNKWLFGIDMIYFDVDDKVKAPVAPGVQLRKAGLKLAYVSPVVSYDIAEFGRSKFRIYTGARYLWAEYTATIRTSAPNPPGGFQDSQSDGRWDAIIGLHGTTSLSDRWYVAYQADIGTGESDSVYQFVGDVNYRFNRIDAVVGYRYMRWDPDSNLFDNFEFKGPFAGAKVKFK